MRMKSFFQRRGQRDRGGATLVMGIISIMFLCLCMAFALDLAKNAYVKNAQNAQAQQAAEVGVKRIDARGSISRNSVQVAVNEYLTQRTGNIIGAQAPLPPRVDESTAFRMANVCQQRVLPQDSSLLDAGATVDAPYLVVRLDETRHLGTALDSATGPTVFVYKDGKFVNGMESDNEGNMVPVPTTGPGTFDKSRVYRVLTVEAYDASSNLMLDMFGIPCQKLNSKVSAITFASKTDIP